MMSTSHDERFDDTVKTLTTQSRCPKVFNNTLMILQHKNWFSEKELELVRGLALTYPYFTKRQRVIMNNIPSLDIDCYQEGGEWDISDGYEEEY